MNIWESLAGICKVDVTSASPNDCINAINEMGIALKDISFKSDVSFDAWITQRNLKYILRNAAKQGAEIHIKEKKGIYWNVIRLFKRPVLLAGIAIVFALFLLLPTRVLFVRVDGNQSIPSRLIVERASDCGIGFWASRRDVRSEKMKNALLGVIPQLEWAGVNTSGCIAVISVKERTDVSLETNDNRHISSIIAMRDGIIQKITAYKGTLLCKVGQAVKKGQVLISGYEDCGICIRGGPSEGEITAQTLRHLQAVTPADYTLRKDLSRTVRNYSIKIGKNLIKLYKDSGISHTGCVKMYSERYVTLPGGFQLPLAMIVETVSYYDLSGETIQNSQLYDTLEAAAESYLLDKAVAGQILQSQTRFSEDNGLLRLYGDYICSEMIGQVRYEGIVQTDEQ